MSEVFVPEEVKLFGASLSSVSISSGLNAQSTTAQLTVVFEDDGPLASEDFEQRFPPLGTCIGLQIGKMQFAGILQRYTQKIDISGYVWDVVLESPSKILEGVQVILSDFMGSSFPGTNLFNLGVRNVWNPFGYRENFNSAGGGIFGGSNSNSVGFPALDLLNIMQFFSTEESFFGRKIIFGESEYELDLLNIVERLSSFQEVRIGGDTQSALSIITEACEFCLCDFISSIRPKDNIYTNGPISNPVIYFKLIDRSIPPDSGVIKRSVKQYEQEGKLVSADVGKELTDTITQRVVIGGPATRYIECIPFTAKVITEKTRYKQIWGKTHDPDPIYVQHIVLEDGRPYYLDYIAPLLELRAAGHSFNSWLLFHSIRKMLSEEYDDLNPTIKGTVKKSKDPDQDAGEDDNKQQPSNIFMNPILVPFLDFIFTDVKITKFNLDRILNGRITPADLLNTALDEKVYGEFGVKVQEQLEKIYNSVKTAYDEYYGVKFAAFLPLEPGGLPNNRKFVREGQHYITTWDVAETAWNDKFPYPEITFYDESGKMKSIAEWKFKPLIHDYSSFAEDYYVAPDIIAAPATPQKDIIFLSDTEAYCVVDVPPVLFYDQYATETNGLYWMLHLMLGMPLDMLNFLYGFGYEAINTSYGIAPAKVYPEYVGIPQVSNRYNWGPWTNKIADNGRAEVIMDSTITPETFGGLGNMNRVGRYYATVINANITGADSGFIELAEFPSGNVGDRFLVSGPYVTSIDISLSTSGYKTTYKFNTWTPEFGKLSKQNIDRLSRLHSDIMKNRKDFAARIRKRPMPKKDYLDKQFEKRKFMQFGNNGFAFEVFKNGKANVGKAQPSRQRGRAKRLRGEQ